jgi:hypothetical protein
MGMQGSLVAQIQPAVLIRLAAHAQRAGKTVNDLLKDMPDERELISQQREGPPTARAQMTPDEWSRALRTWGQATRSALCLPMTVVRAYMQGAANERRSRHEHPHPRRAAKSPHAPRGA